MSKVYFLPGFLGSELRKGSPSGALVWVNPADIVSGGLRDMALDPDVPNETPANKSQLIAGNPLPVAYQASMVTLAQQLEGSGRTLVGCGFDWRKDMVGIAARLADTIRTETAPGDFCEVVGHSQGGLIARLAWYNLKQTSQQSLIRRIITIGTPHYGLYNPVALWFGDNKTAFAISLTTIALGASMAFPAIQPYSQDEIVRISATWPAMYQLLPSTDQPAQGGDPARFILYDAGFYPGKASVSQPFINYARGTFATQLRSADSLPPGRRLVTIAGTGFTTHATLTVRRVINIPVPFFGDTQEGDGSVTKASAHLPSAEQYTVRGEHTGLFTQLVNDGLLEELIQTDTFADNDPVPAESIDNTTPPYQAYDPPGAKTGDIKTQDFDLPGNTQGDYSEVSPDRKVCIT